MHLSLRFKHLSFFAALLLFGACASSPVHRAAEKGDIPGLQQALAQGGQLDAPNSLGITPLMLAVNAGKTEMVAYLLANGAKINATNSNGYTPLMYAASLHRVDLTRQLLGSGADVNAKEKRGFGALRLAQGPIVCNVSYCATQKDKDQVIALLKKAGAK